MKFSHSAVLAFIASLATVNADSCSQVGGNYYCDSTTKITYSGIGYSGSYQDVTNMDESSGSCSQSSTSFSGNLSPLNEELSVHFRGPLKLLQFGVYYPSGSSNNAKRDDSEEECVTKHVHHKHKRATELVEVTQTVTVNGQGQTVVSSAPAAATQQSQGNSNAVNKDENIEASSSTVATTTISTSDSSSPSSSSSSDSSSSGSVGGAWERVAYYEPGTATNITFLNHYGGSGSGVWSSSFGNSLSYCNSDASGGSSSPVALEEVTVQSDVEYLIMSSQECNGDDCGYYREGIPAYHGFGGTEKIFVFEFEMPTASDSVTNNHDMPAIWLLNAKIPRTLQYGSSSCSCWSTGCGEFDIFEVLSSGEDKLISHLHDGQGDDGTSSGGSGSSDYFERPTSGSMKAAVIFNGEDIQILEVDSSFDSFLSESTVSGWMGQSGSTANNV